MKKIAGLFSIVALLALVAACSGPKGERAETGEAKAKTTSDANADEYFIDTTYSMIYWRGSKPTGEHHGTINIRDGFLKVLDGEIVGGEIHIDMYTIDNLDLKGTDSYDKLVGHLKSEDFWAVNTYPTSLFQIVEVTEIENPEMIGDTIMPSHRITGNLTMLDKTKSISFNAKVDMENGKIVAETPQFLIDRTNWGIVFKSKSVFENLADNFIHDDIGLVIKMRAAEKGQI